MNTLITCRHVDFGYENHDAVVDLSMEVDEGDYLCVVGANGSGKSTLVKGLLGLIKPLKGELTVAEELRRTGIGYLPQQTAAQRDFPATVREVVLSGTLSRRAAQSSGGAGAKEGTPSRRAAQSSDDAGVEKGTLNRGAAQASGDAGMKEKTPETSFQRRRPFYKMPFYSAEDKRQAAACMEKLGISDLKNHCYRELSGGQQQRVLIARALCAASRMLILDEPITGLDPSAIQDFYRLVRRLNRDEGVTILMVTHDVAGVISQANRILHLQQRVVFFGKPEDYRRTAAGRRYLGGEDR